MSIVYAEKNNLSIILMRNGGEKMDIKRYTADEWRLEGRRRFGDDVMNWKFLCPMCGHVASVRDFKNAGASGPDCAYTECIGRYIGKGSQKKDDSSGCDWCCYGLYGIPQGGIIVDGLHIFDFAEEN